MMVVYCHPSHNSFTYQVKEHFIRGLKDAGHQVEVADLYGDDFQSDMSESEYLREAFYDESKDIPEDVRKYQRMIERSDAIAFIYPVFWSEAPAKLVGWFQRVWTYGFAYGQKTMKILMKSLFLVTMGGDVREALRQRQIAAMKEVMLGDRMSARAENHEFVVYDRMSRDYPDRHQKMSLFLEDAYLRGKQFEMKKRG